MAKRHQVPVIFNHIVILHDGTEWNYVRTEKDSDNKIVIHLESYGEWKTVTEKDIAEILMERM